MITYIVLKGISNYATADLYPLDARPTRAECEKMIEEDLNRNKHLYEASGYEFDVTKKEVDNETDVKYSVSIHQPTLDETVSWLIVEVQL